MSSCHGNLNGFDAEESNIKLEFGLRDGKIIDIDDILENERGLKCKCICPLCNKPLQAKLGHGKRQKHFAHNNANCNSKAAKQTTIHILAKEILETNKKIMLPKYTIFDDSNYGHLSDDAQYEIRQISTVIPEQLFCFDKVYLEKKLDSIIPDVILEKGGKQLIVEIAVTHFVDEKKEDKIKKMNISALEINLSHLYEEKVIKSILEKEIIQTVDNKYWIYNTHHDAAIMKLKEKNKTIVKKDVKEQNRLAREAAIKELEKQQFLERTEAIIKDALKEDNYNQRVKSNRDNEATKKILIVQVFIVKVSLVFHSMLIYQ